MVKLNHESDIKTPKGPHVVVIHAKWCGHCTELIPKWEKDVITSDQFDPELKDILTLESIEDKVYSTVKDVFGEVDGYPTIRYIDFDENGKPIKDNNGVIMIDANVPREPKDIIKWINTVVKGEVMKKHNQKHNQKHSAKNSNHNNNHVGGKNKSKTRRTTKNRSRRSRLIKKTKSIRRK